MIVWTLGVYEGNKGRVTIEITIYMYTYVTIAAVSYIHPPYNTALCYEIIRLKTMYLKYYYYFVRTV